MLYYVLREKTTGFYFPPIRNGQRGSSHSVFGPGMPRLFLRKQDAEACLRYWLKGHHYVVRHSWGSEGDCEESWEVEPKPERGSRGQYEVLAVRVEALEGTREEEGNVPKD